MVSPITSFVSNLLVGSLVDAACVLQKYMVAIVGLPKSSKIVIDVELVNVFGSFGLKLYPPLVNSGLDVTTSAVAGKFTPKEMLLVAFGSPDVIGN